MAESSSADYIFKIVLTGDSGVGKSNLLSRFTRNEFSLESRSTIGVEFSTKEVQVDGKTIKVQIWDTGKIHSVLVRRSMLLFSRPGTLYGHYQSLLSKCPGCSGRLWYSQSVDLSESRSMVCLMDLSGLDKTLSLFLASRYNEVRANAGIDCCIILVGNKSDQRHIRAVLNEDAKRYADERNIQ